MFLSITEKKCFSEDIKVIESFKSSRPLAERRKISLISSKKQSSSDASTKQMT